MKLMAVYFDNNLKHLITRNSQQWKFLSLLSAVLYQGISRLEEVNSIVYTLIKIESALHWVRTSRILTA
jgi:hypothetical protein